MRLRHIVLMVWSTVCNGFCICRSFVYILEHVLCFRQFIYWVLLMICVDTITSIFIVFYTFVVFSTHWIIAIHVKQHWSDSLLPREFAGGDKLPGRNSLCIKIPCVIIF